jgi:DNA-binding CsgD family transcriptional regulator
LVEVAYRPARNTRAWLQGVADTTRSLLPRETGVFAMAVDLSDAKRVKLDEFVSAGATDALKEFVTGVTPTLSEADQAETYRSPIVFGTMSERLGGPERYRGHWVFQEFQRRGWVDFDLLLAFDPTGLGCIVAWEREDIGSTPRRTGAMWGRLAAHLTAGLRLQQALGAGRTPGELDEAQADAILRPSGRLEHASAEAAASRDRLRDAVIAVERVRSSRGARDPEAALEAWRGLVAGKWSLVDLFDRDGRRFVVARRNDVQPNGPAPLTLRERQVLAYVGLGHSNRLASYHLGLSESTVAEHLARAMLKLGLRSRMDVMRLFAGAR